VSEGCRHCYAERQAARFCGPGQPYEGLVKFTEVDLGAMRPAKSLNVVDGRLIGRQPRWTGEVRLVPERLADPLRWRKPCRVFVNSMSDLFHEKLSNEDIAAVFGVMAAAPHHTFQVLTKRPSRMRAWFAWAAEQGEELQAGVGEQPPSGSPVPAACALLATVPARLSRKAFNTAAHAPWPLPNVWLGVSVEDQATADERIPVLLETPAAIRFVSYEPALGPINLRRVVLHAPIYLDALGGWRFQEEGGDIDTRRLDWVIAGSESGPGARPAELDWFRSVRDQCAAAAVPYFFKQWVGERGVCTNGLGVHHDGTTSRKVSLPILDGQQHVEWPR
jgi:protein gp37